MSPDLIAFTTAPDGVVEGWKTKRQCDRGSMASGMLHRNPKLPS